MNEPGKASLRPVEVPSTVPLKARVHPEPGAGGYSAEVSALPHCETQGETLPIPTDLARKSSQDGK